MIVVYGSD